MAVNGLRTPWFRGNIRTGMRAPPGRNPPDERPMNANYWKLNDKNLTEP
jgi:hypothetical protein